MADSKISALTVLAALASADSLVVVENSTGLNKKSPVSALDNKYQAKDGSGNVNVVGDLTVEKTSASLNINDSSGATNSKKFRLFRYVGTVIARVLNDNDTTKATIFRYTDSTGVLSLSEDGTVVVPTPTVDANPTTKLYVDTADSALFPKSGGVLSGNITINKATDTRVILKTSDGPVDAKTWDLVANNAGVANIRAINDAGSVATSLLRFTTTDSEFVAPVRVSAPSADLHPATKKYVDDAITALKAAVYVLNNHGSTAATARIAGYAGNIWVGSVTPTNATGSDFVIRTDEAV